MTTLAQPPAPVETPRPSRGGAPARRAIRRWAWRLLRREWRQQLMVLLLLTVAVAATVIGLGLVVNVQGTDQALFGTADARIDIADPGPRGVGVDVAAARTQFGTVEAIDHESVAVPGSITPVDVRSQDPSGKFGAPMLHVVSGKYPTGADQVAVTAAVATTFKLVLGSTWLVNGTSLRVVGMIENPKNLQDAFGLVAVGTIASPSSVTLLFNAPADAIQHYHARAGSVQSIMSSGASNAQEQRNQALAVLLLATIGLTFIGLLSVAGFTVMAQRRLRALGMIGAIGATDRQVRRVMLTNGAAVGTVGGLFGAVLGLAVWLGLTPAFEKVVGHRYDPFALPWWAVIAGAVLAILTAVAASWWPSRTAAKLPIVAALSGRPAPPQPAHRFAVLGTALAAAGFVSLLFAHPGDTTRPALIIGGIVATAAGMLLLAPLGIRALSRVSGRAPIAVRLALRDLARYQARSGSALAAATLAVGIAATIAVTAAAQQAHDHALTGGNLPTNQLIVWLANPNNQDGPGMSVVPADARLSKPAVPNPAVVDSAHSTADSIARALGSDTVVEIDTAVDLSSRVPAGAPPDAAEANLVRPISVQGPGQGWTLVAIPYVATPAVLALYGIAAGDVSAGADILSARRDLHGIEIGSGFKGDFQPATVQVSARLPNYTSAPSTLITAHGMHARHYTAEPAGWLVQAPHPLTSAQIADARNRAAEHGITIETRTGRDNSLQRLRDYSTAAGVLLALGVLAMTVGLIRSESGNDLRTLTATGAGGATRRTLTAASAGALALLAGILGTAAAYLALIAWHWHDIGYLDQPPYANLAILILGLPAVAVLGAWLLSRTPTTIARRSLE